MNMEQVILYDVIILLLGDLADNIASVKLPPPWNISLATPLAEKIILIKNF